MADPIVENRSARMIRQNEGFEGSVYRDTRGIKTVGIGFNAQDAAIAQYLPSDVLAGKRKMTEKEAQEIFQTKILPIAQKDAAAFVGNDTFAKLDPVRQQVLVDLAYNMGGPRLNGFKNTRAAIQAGDFDRASAELLNSNYARSKDTAARALRNAQMLRTGQSQQ